MKELKQYLTEVRRNLECGWKLKKEILTMFSYYVSDCMDGKPYTLPELYEEFGRPEQVARKYLAVLLPEEIAPYRKRMAALRRLCIAFALIIAVVISGCLSYTITSGVFIEYAPHEADFMFNLQNEAVDICLSNDEINIRLKDAPSYTTYSRPEQQGLESYEITIVKSIAYLLNGEDNDRAALLKIYAKFRVEPGKRVQCIHAQAVYTLNHKNWTIDTITTFKDNSRNNVAYAMTTGTFKQYIMGFPVKFFTRSLMISCDIYGNIR